MSKPKRKPTNKPTDNQQHQKTIPSEIKISGTVNTVAGKAKQSIISIISIVIAAAALIISIFSLVNSNKQLRLEAAPKIGLNVAYFKGNYDNEEDEDYTVYHGPAEDETGNKYNYNHDRKVRTVEIFNEGAPLQSIDIKVLPYFRIYETSRIYDEEAQCPVGISTDLYYLPIDNHEKAYAVYRNGTSQGTLAIIGDAFISDYCVMKIGNDQLRNETPGGYPRFTCFEEDMSGKIVDPYNDKEYQDYVRTLQKKYVEYSYEGDYDDAPKKDKFGYVYYHGHLKVVSVINLAYYLQITYKDYFGRDGQKVYNVNTGYENQYWSYYDSKDLPGIYDVTDNDKIYNMISHKDYTIGYTADDNLDTVFEDNGTKYTANILEYLISDHDIKQHIETQYVSDKSSWEW